MVGLVVEPTTLDKGAGFDPCGPDSSHPGGGGEFSVLCPLSSVLCPLSSVLCPLSSVHRLAGRPCWDVAVIGTATVRQELPVSPIVPSLPPHLVQLGFDYVLAVETGDDVQAARLAPEVEQLPGLL